MSTSIADILGKRKPEEPPEIVMIKSFVRDNYDAGCTVHMKPGMIIIQVSSAGLAGSLRMRLHELQAEVGSAYRLTIRIS